MRRATALAIVCLGAVAACSDDSTSQSTSPTTPQTVAEVTTPVVASTAPVTAADTTPETTAPETTTPAPTTEAAPAGWRQVTASAECMCSDGSPYSYWIREADPTKVVFFLQGGGACFDATTCAANSGTYKTTTGAGDDPGNIGSGIFDLTDARNPLADYSMVYAPYCTGDVHIGNSSHEYGPQLTVHHKGYINASTALNDLATQFPDATQIVVTGESAGSIPTPLYAGLAHDLLPNADITVLADGSGRRIPMCPRSTPRSGRRGERRTRSRRGRRTRTDGGDVELPRTVRAGPQARSRDHLRSS